MKSVSVLVIEPDPGQGDVLSVLSGSGNCVYHLPGLAANLALPGKTPPAVIIADAASISFRSLREKIAPETALILTGKDAAILRDKASEWPVDRYVDTAVIVPGDEAWKSPFLLVFERAASFARLRMELNVLRRTHGEQEEKLKEVLKEVSEVRGLIRNNFIREVERRIAIETKYLWFQKEQQKIETIIRRIYEADDVVSLLDVVPEIRDVVKAQSATVYVVDESENLGRFLKPILWDNAYLAHSEFAAFVTSADAPDFASASVRYKHPIHVTDIPSGTKTPHRYRSLLKIHLQNLLAVPIMHGSEVIGVIEVYNKMGLDGVSGAGFSRDDQELLGGLSEHMALAMMKLNLIHYDALTGLLRPDPFFEMVQKKTNAMRKRSREEGPKAMVMGDVDWFKNYNDRNGQEAGNKLLRELAHILRGAIREDDLICRYGGEEFLFFLTGVKNLDDACNFTERIRKSVEDHYFDFQEFQPRRNLTMSFGVTIFPKGPADMFMPLTKAHLKKLVGEADLALAEAKGKPRPELAGRGESLDVIKNRVRCYGLAMADRSLRSAGSFSTPTFREMRKTERFNISTLLMFKDDGTYQVAKTANLSLGGAKLITEAGLPVAATIEALLVLDNRAKMMKGDIVYSTKAAADMPCFYSGFKFRDLSMQQISMLEGFLQDLRKKNNGRS